MIFELQFAGGMSEWMSMKFVYRRKIRFADTDAAGVVYFANYFSICHEAYEEALAEHGIELRSFFSEEDVVIPISYARSDFLRPLHCGDAIEVEVTPGILKDDSFYVDYKLYAVKGNQRKLAANARTDHVCLDSNSRRRRHLPEKLSAWMQMY